MLRDRLLKIALEKGVSPGEMRRLAEAVAERRRDPYSVVEEIIERIGI
jgi:hypothetical protein